MDELTRIIRDCVPEPSLKRLGQIWEDLGYTEDQITQRRDTVIVHIQKLIGDMVAEEQELKDRIISEIESYLKQRSAICRDLDLKVPNDEDVDMTLIEMRENLKLKLSEYQIIKERRLQLLADLEAREKLLMEALGIPRRFPIPANIPSLEQLDNFREYLDAKSEDKHRLEQVFHASRAAIKDIMNQMDIKPELNFEAQVIDGIEHFQLSHDNMAQLKELHQSLVRRLQEAKDLSVQLREKLRTLWDRLNEPAELQQAFVQGYVGYSTETIKALKMEINRCEAKKRDNIKKFVETVRAELVVWWERCRVSDEERARFRHYNSDLFNEDLLDLHEQEVARLTQYYNDNRNVFQLVERFQEMWDRMIVLEDKAQQPNRFDNRGGQLLIEEKERKTILRNLPKIEKELVQHLETYEMTCGRAFTIDGQQVDEFLKEMWDSHKENKERQKMARKMRNQSNVDGLSATTRSGASMKRKIGLTPESTIKALKRGKVAPGSTTITSARPVRRLSGQQKVDVQSRVKKVARKIFNNTRANDAATIQPDVLTGAGTSAGNLTSYTDFQSACQPGYQRQRTFLIGPHTQVVSQLYQASTARLEHARKEAAHAGRSYACAHVGGALHAGRTAHACYPVCGATYAGRLPLLIWPPRHRDPTATAARHGDVQDPHFSSDSGIEDTTVHPC